MTILHSLDVKFGSFGLRSQDYSEGTFPRLPDPRFPQPTSTTVVVYGESTLGGTRPETSLVGDTYDVFRPRVI